MTIYIKALRPKVGDFVEYKLNTPTQEKLNKLNSDIANYSGANDNTAKTATGDTLLCRILEVDKKGNPTKLISANGIDSLKLYGANGYNNGVYLIDEMCKTLYSGSQGITRSLTIEDLEDNYFSEEAIRTRNTYDNGTLTYGKTIYYETNAKYPNIALEEAKMGIATTLVDGKNQIRNGGLSLSKQDKLYTGSGDASTVDVTKKGMTVTQTYYPMSQGDNNYKNATLNNIIYKSPTSSSIAENVSIYWLASRCVDTYSTYCGFYVRYVNSGNVGDGIMLVSNGISQR